MLLVASCWVPCDGLASHPGGSGNAPNLFMLQNLELSAATVEPPGSFNPLAFPIHVTPSRPIEKGV